MNVSKPKKHHYVPQLALRNFSYDKKQEHVYVIDKTIPVYRKGAINDVAEEKYFYKLNFKEYAKGQLSSEQKKKFNDACKKDYGKTLDELTDEDMDNIDFSIENYFATKIEPGLKKITQKIIDCTYNGNKWVAENCGFVNLTEKAELSFYIAHEFVRTKHYRDLIINAETGLYKKLIPIIAQMQGINIKETDFSVHFSKEGQKINHLQSIVQTDAIRDFAKIFAGKIWVLLENATEEKFCLNDIGITLISTEKLPDFYGYGLLTYGMAIYYPISPNLVLLMLDPNKFKSNFKDNTIRLINKIDLIRDINLGLLTHAYKYVYFNNEEDAIVYTNFCKKEEILRQQAPLGEVY